MFQFPDIDNIFNLTLLTAGLLGFAPNGGSQLTNPFSGSGFADMTRSATFTATPVPWETDALPVIGSTVLFELGLWAKNKFAKPLQK